MKAALGLLDGLTTTTRQIAPHLHPSDELQEQLFSSVGCAAHRDLARQAVSQSCGESQHV